MLLALVGLAGAGKTTAIEKLEGLGFGERFYVGQVLRNELSRRALPVTPTNERIVREELRHSEGMDVFARLACPHIEDMLCKTVVLLDAIYCAEELDFYRANLAGRIEVLSIAACQNTRGQRLVGRPDRPMTKDDLARRDALELRQYRLGDVVGGANFSLENEGSLNDLEETLRGMLASLRRV